MPEEIKPGTPESIMNGDGKAQEKTPPAPSGPSGASGAAQTGAAETGAAQTGAAQTGAAQTGAQQSGPSGATGPNAPEKYDLKLPEGSLLEASEIEKIASLAKERGLSNKDAQALLDDRSKLLDSYAGKQKETWGKETGRWLEVTKADPEIGGEAFGKNAELAKRVVTRFGTPELMQGLNETGFGNHPELVRLMVRIGKAMDDDQLVMPGSKTPAVEKNLADVFYGGSNENKDK